MTDLFDRLNIIGVRIGISVDIEMFASDRPFFLYAAYNWHEHLVLGGNRAYLQLMKPQYTKILDVGEPAFWVWFLSLSARICDRSNISRSMLAISSVWKAPAETDHLNKKYGKLLRGDCLAKLFSMDNNLYLLLGNCHPSPRFVEGEPLEGTQKHLAIRYSTPGIDQLQWKATGGYELIDEFHIASGEYEFTTASQAVLALEEGNEERGIALSETVPKSTLVWTCVANNKPCALRKVLASIHDLEWLHEIPDYIAYGRINYLVKDTRFPAYLYPVAGRLRKERQSGFTGRWPAASIVIFRTCKRHSSTTVDLFGVLADWIEASSYPQHNAQKLWEAGGFFDLSLCRRLISSGVSVNCKMWKDDVTALHCAAALWEHDLIQVLIGLGADAVIRSTSGYNALHWFLTPGDPLHLVDLNLHSVVKGHRQIGDRRYEKRLISASVKAIAHPSTIDAPLSDGTTPLMLAARRSPTATMVLLAQRADLEKRDDQGRTALMHFFRSGLNGRPIRILNYLLDAGANSLAPDSQNQTALGYWVYALLFNSLSHLDPGSNSFNKAFHQLANAKPLSRREVLVQQLGNFKIPLVVAARLGNAELCWALMDSGAHPDEHGVPKDSPIGHNSGSLSMELEDTAWNPVLVALHSKAYTTAAILLAYGADVDFQAPKPKSTKYGKYGLATVGMTPLHIAIQGGSRYSNYNSHQSISLGSGGINSCAFSVATHPDHLVEGVSVMEILAKSETQRLAELKDMDDNAPSSDVSKTCKLQMLCYEMCGKANQR